MKLVPAFPLKFLFALMTLSALAVLMFRPGAYLVYGPALIIATLSLCLIYQVRQSPARFSRWNLNNSWKPISLAIALLMFVVAAILLSDLAYKKYQAESLASDQINRALSIPDPVGFRAAALRFHATLLQQGEATIRGDSELVPAAIKRLRPYYIIARQDYIAIQLSPDNDVSVSVHSDESTNFSTNVRVTKIADGIYCWQ